jgi:CBS domain-containing protein
METHLIVLLKDKGHKIQSISPSDSVYHCAQKLAEYKVGALLVMEQDKLLGIVSERDILRKIVAIDADAKSIKVADIMTSDLVTVLPSTSVREAMRIVTDRRVRHLPVIENGKLVGLISIGDLTRWAMLLQEQQISNLTSYIHGDRIE